MRVIIKNADFEVYGIADISGLLAEVQNKFGGITDITPVKNFFCALGADGTNPIWSKIKRLYMPCLGIPADGANALYDIIGKNNFPGSNFKIEAKRGVSPTTQDGGSIGLDNLPSGIGNSNLSFFFIVTQRTDLSISSSAGEVLNLGGIKVDWEKELGGNYRFRLSNNSVGDSVVQSGDFTSPQPGVVSIPENGSRTMIASANIVNTTTVETSTTTFSLSGIRTWAETAVLAICDGLTSSEISTVLDALNNLISDYGIVSANT